MADRAYLSLHDEEFSASLSPVNENPPDWRSDELAQISSPVITPISVEPSSPPSSFSDDIASNLEQNQEGNKGAVTIGGVEGSIELPSLANPPITKTKGHKKQDGKESKNGCIKSGFEVRMKNSKKTKRQRKNWGQYCHYYSTCERRKLDDAMEDAPTQSSKECLLLD